MSTETVAIQAQDSLGKLIVQLHHLAQRASTAERDLERERQETGRLRARVEELEAATCTGCTGHCHCPESQYRPCECHDPDGYAAWAQDGMDTAADPDPDYGKDLDDEEGPF